jgi:hypothetical protein
VQVCTADKLSIRYGPEARPFDPLIDTRLEALTQNTAFPFIRRLDADFGLNARGRSGWWF